MSEKDIKTREIIISRNGKPLFAVRIDSGEDRDANYVFVENGDIKFSSSWLSSIVPFSLGNESHRLAKEIFTIGLQAAVKTKVYELKQIESILKDINLAECLGNVLVDNTRLLIEVNDNINKKTNQIIEIAENQLKKTDEKVDKCVEEVSKKVVGSKEIKETVVDAIVETVKPIAVKRIVKK